MGHTCVDCSDYPSAYFTTLILACFFLIFVWAIFATPTYWNGSVIVAHGGWIDEDWIDTNGHRYHRHRYEQRSDPAQPPGYAAPDRPSEYNNVGLAGTENEFEV